MTFIVRLIYVYIYIYIYMCVCVCMCVCVWDIEVICYKYIFRSKDVYVWRSMQKIDIY